MKLHLPAVISVGLFVGSWACAMGSQENEQKSPMVALVSEAMRDEEAPDLGDAQEVAALKRVQAGRKFMPKSANYSFKSPESNPGYFPRFYWVKNADGKRVMRMGRLRAIWH
jgi:hypothetical protein